MGLEVVVVPVSDVDRAEDFSKKLGWRLDADFVAGEGFLRADGVELHLGQRASAASREDGEYVPALSDGAELRGDRLLVAVGRRPRVEGLGLGPDYAGSTWRAGSGSACRS